MTHISKKKLHPSGARLGGGSNQTRVRDHNERLVLSLIRQGSAVSRAEIARASGLSAQTATVIIRALESDGLLLRGTPKRGKVGQPSIPMRLNPDGAYSIGLKVGRRSADLVLMDFVGTIKKRVHIAYSFPTIEDVLAFAQAETKQFLKSLPDELAQRVAGIGIAMPFGIWNWGLLVGAPVEKMDAWRTFDLMGAVENVTGLPTLMENDATAACGAELLLGRGQEFQNFGYLFIGFFIGGGIVLNNTVFSGPTGNAGSFGTMPISVSDNDHVQLLDCASIFVLGNMLRDEGKDSSVLWKNPNDWGDLGETLTRWIELVGKSLATAILSTCTVIDFETILIDGGCPDNIRDRIVAETTKHLQQMDLSGIGQVSILAGSVGSNAPAIGGAILPIVSRYFINQAAIYH